MSPRKVPNLTDVLTLKNIRLFSYLQFARAEQEFFEVNQDKAATLAALQSFSDRLLNRFPQPLPLAAGGYPFDTIFYFLIDILELLNIFL